jgi:hypothetical protein
MNVPAPILVRPPVPAIEPEKMVLVLSLPMVSIALPSVTPPAPASEPIDWLKLLRSSVAPLATVNELNGEKALTAPACSVPTLTAVAPV